MPTAVSLKGAFDRIIVDPPFLSDECQTKGSNYHFLTTVHYR